MSKEFPSGEEPQTPEGWLEESHREKFERRFAWIMQARRALFDEVMQDIGEKYSGQTLYQVFTSGNNDVDNYALKLGVTLDVLIAQDFVSKEDLLASGSTDIE